MSKHTSGEWNARGQHVEGPLGVTVAFCGASMVAGVDGSYSISEDEARTNARLIAAAPVLYDALVAIGGGVGTQIAFLKRLGADGPERLRSGGPWDKSDSYFGDDYETQARWNAPDQEALQLAVIRAAIAKAEGK